MKNRSNPSTRNAKTHLYYRWRVTKLYLNLLKPPVPNEDNPEELTYGFAFREDAKPDEGKPQLWYLVGRILDFEDAEDAKLDMKSQLVGLPEDQQENANRLIGRLHNRIHTTTVANYYQEKSQDYDKVLQIFVRANSAGQPLEYSDLLLATATAKWETVDARSEIHNFTDSLNEIGNGYNFGKDFVLKACLYLSEGLPIQYKVKNFTRNNLRIIEENWEKIKASLSTTVRLISRFGFNEKNVVAPLALLPIAFYLMKRGNSSFDTSSKADRHCPPEELLPDAQPFCCALISPNLASARSNISLKSHIESRISRMVADVLARSALPKANMLLLRKYPMIRGSEIL